MKRTRTWDGDKTKGMGRKELRCNGNDEEEDNSKDSCQVICQHHHHPPRIVIAAAAAVLATTRHHWSARITSPRWHKPLHTAPLTPPISICSSVRFILQVWNWKDRNNYYNLLIKDIIFIQLQKRVTFVLVGIRLHRNR